MNDMCPAQQPEADSRPEVVVRRYHHQPFFRGLYEMDQNNDEHRVDQLLFLACQYGSRLNGAAINGATGIPDERVKRRNRAA